MLSMTGFGGGEGQAGLVTVAVEFRSVNHRFLDVSLKLPGTLGVFEPDIRQFLKENIARGRITVSLQMTLNRDAVPVQLDAKRLEQGLLLLQEAAAGLEKTTGKTAEITLDHVLSVPDILRVEEPEIPVEDIRAALMAGLQEALKGLQAMKQAEGNELVKEMNQRLVRLSENLAEVNEQAPLAAAEIQQRLEERLEKLVTEAVDPQRLAQEVAMLAERGNINEECERLAIHIEHFTKALEEGGQVAKRLNFLLQEMHREVNTMGSKTGVMAITQAVIVMKDEVESLREQIQNLE